MEDTYSQDEDESFLNELESSLARITNNNSTLNRSSCHTHNNNSIFTFDNNNQYNTTNNTANTQSNGGLLSSLSAKHSPRPVLCPLSPYSKLHGSDSLASFAIPITPTSNRLPHNLSNIDVNKIIIDEKDEQMLYYFLENDLATPINHHKTPSSSSSSYPTSSTHYQQQQQQQPINNQFDYMFMDNQNYDGNENTATTSDNHQPHNHTNASTYNTIPLSPLLLSGNYHRNPLFTMDGGSNHPYYSHDNDNTSAIQHSYHIHAMHDIQSRQSSGYVNQQSSAYNNNSSNNYTDTNNDDDINITANTNKGKGKRKRQSKASAKQGQQSSSHIIDLPAAYSAQPIPLASPALQSAPHILTPRATVPTTSTSTTTGVTAAAKPVPLPTTLPPKIQPPFIRPKPDIALMPFCLQPTFTLPSMASFGFATSATSHGITPRSSSSGGIADNSEEQGQAQGSTLTGIRKQRRASTNTSVPNDAIRPPSFAEIAALFFTDLIIVDGKLQPAGALASYIANKGEINEGFYKKRKTISFEGYNSDPFASTAGEARPESKADKLLKEIVSRIIYCLTKYDPAEPFPAVVPTVTVLSGKTDVTADSSGNGGETQHASNNAVDSHHGDVPADSDPSTSVTPQPLKCTLYQAYKIEQIVQLIYIDDDLPYLPSTTTPTSIPAAAENVTISTISEHASENRASALGTLSSEKAGAVGGGAGILRNSFSRRVYTIMGVLEDLGLVC